MQRKREIIYIVIKTDSMCADMQSVSKSGTDAGIFTAYRDLEDARAVMKGAAAEYFSRKEGKSMTLEGVRAKYPVQISEDSVSVRTDDSGTSCEYRWSVIGVEI